MGGEATGLIEALVIGADTSSCMAKPPNEIAIPTERASFHPNGRRERLRDVLPDGSVRVREWYDTGRRKWELVTGPDGEVVSEDGWYRHGELRRRVRPLRGGRTRAESWYADGTPRKDITWDDEATRAFRSWFPTGMPRCEQPRGPRGTTRWWRIDGTLEYETVTLRGGQRVTRKFFADGTLQGEREIDGQGRDHGTWRSWNRDGSLREEQRMRRGERHGRQELLASDGTRLVRTWRAGRGHGIERCWRGDGTLRWRVRWQDGTLEGPVVAYHRSGRLERRGQFAGDLPCGEWEYRHDDGSLRAMVRYTKAGVPRLPVRVRDAQGVVTTVRTSAERSALVHVVGLGALVLDEHGELDAQPASSVHESTSYLRDLGRQGIKDATMYEWNQDGVTLRCRWVAGGLVLQKRLRAGGRWTRVTSLEPFLARGRARIVEIAVAPGLGHVAAVIDRDGRERRFDLVVIDCATGAAQRHPAIVCGESSIVVWMSAATLCHAMPARGRGTRRRQLVRRGVDGEVRVVSTGTHLRWKLRAGGGIGTVTTWTDDGCTTAMFSDAGQPERLVATGAHVTCTSHGRTHLAVLDGIALMRSAGAPLDHAAWSSAHVSDLDSPLVYAQAVGSRTVVRRRRGGRPGLALLDGSRLRELRAPGDCLYGVDVTDSGALLLRGVRGDYRLGRDGTPQPAGPIDARIRVRNLTATSADGTRIPITLVEPAEPKAHRPLLLEVYGGFNNPLEIGANAARFADRGIAVAYAHVRGGADLGEAWWDAARHERKQASIDDLIACARHLRARGHAGKMCWYGGSAGGFLVAAAMNQAPDLADGVIASVPWLDLKDQRWDEAAFADAGDIARAEFELDISPYEHVPRTNLPDVLTIVGGRDARCRWSEGVKWIRRVRERATNDPVALALVLPHVGHSLQGSAADANAHRHALYDFIDRVTSPPPTRSTSPRPAKPPTAIVTTVPDEALAGFRLLLDK